MSGAIAIDGIRAAEFTNGSKTRDAVLTFNVIANGTRTFISSRSVSGKREARSLAQKSGFTPWNF